MPPKTHVVRVRVDGEVYTGWQGVSVTRTLEALCASFSIEHTDRDAIARSFRRIVEGSHVEIDVDGERLVTGYVDGVRPRFSGQSHAASFHGRDLCKDLVDCSAMFPGKEWADRKLEDIVAQLASPFGIKTQVLADTGDPFGTFSIQGDESPFGAIDRLCRHRGLRPATDPFGTLLLTRAGTTAVEPVLIDGENILEADGDYTEQDRFSSYHVHGQQGGDDFLALEETSAPFAVAADPNVKRYRPKMILAEDAGGSGQLQVRADWEAATRSGKAKRLNVTLQGWRKADGGLWQPNDLARIDSDYLGWRGDALIASAQYTQGESTGTRIKLNVARPGAFDVLPVPDEEEADVLL